MVPLHDDDATRLRARARTALCHVASDFIDGHHVVHNGLMLEIAHVLAASPPALELETKSLRTSLCALVKCVVAVCDGRKLECADAGISLGLNKLHMQTLDIQACRAASSIPIGARLYDLNSRRACAHAPAMPFGERALRVRSGGLATFVDAAFRANIVGIVDNKKTVGLFTLVRVLYENAPLANDIIKNGEMDSIAKAFAGKAAAAIARLASDDPPHARVRDLHQMRILGDQYKKMGGGGCLAIAASGSALRFASSALRTTTAFPSSGRLKLVQHKCAVCPLCTSDIQAPTRVLNKPAAYAALVAEHLRTHEGAFCCPTCLTYEAEADGLVAHTCRGKPEVRAPPRLTSLLPKAAYTMLTHMAYQVNDAEKVALEEMVDIVCTCLSGELVLYGAVAELARTRGIEGNLSTGVPDNFDRDMRPLPGNRLHTNPLGDVAMTGVARFFYQIPHLPTCPTDRMVIAETLVERAARLLLFDPTSAPVLRSDASVLTWLTTTGNVIFADDRVRIAAKKLAKKVPRVTDPGWLGLACSTDQPFASRMLHKLRTAVLAQAGEICCGPILSRAGLRLLHAERVASTPASLLAYTSDDAVLQEAAALVEMTSEDDVDNLVASLVERAGRWEQTVLEMPNTGLSQKAHKAAEKARREDAEKAVKAAENAAEKAARLETKTREAKARREHNEANPKRACSAAARYAQALCDQDEVECLLMDLVQRVASEAEKASAQASA